MNLVLYKLHKLLFALSYHAYMLSLKNGMPLPDMSYHRRMQKEYANVARWSAEYDKEHAN